MTFPVIDRLLATVNARDPDGIANCFTEDYTCEWPAHPNLSFTGRDVARRNQIRRFELRPTVQAKILHSVVVGDEVWGEWHFYDEPGGLEERGVIILVVDRDRDLIRSSRFYMEMVKDLHPR